MVEVDTFTRLFEELVEGFAYTWADRGLTIGEADFVLPLPVSDTSPRVFECDRRKNNAVESFRTGDEAGVLRGDVANIADANKHRDLSKVRPLTSSSSIKPR